MTVLPQLSLRDYSTGGNPRPPIDSKHHLQEDQLVQKLLALCFVENDRRDDSNQPRRNVTYEHATTGCCYDSYALQ